MKTNALLTVVALSFASAGCGAATTSLAPAPGLTVPAGAQVATVSATPSGGGYTAVGTVEARTTATLAARVAGYVTAIRAGVGDRVKTGAVLITLATPEAGQQVSEAQAGVEAARAQLAAARRQTMAAAAQASLAASTYKRYQQLLQTQAVSPHEFDQVAAANQAAAADHAAARARQQAAQSGLAQSQAALAQARTQAGFDTITAPFDAVVTAKPAAVGDLAMPGTPLIVLEAGGGWDLAVSVPNQRLSGIKVGQTVSATVDGLPSPVQARVREIAPASDPAARAAIVKLALPGAPGLRAGLFGQVSLPSAGPAATSLAVADAALVRFGELDQLYVLDPAGRAELRIVTLGATNAGQVEVLSGLNPGDRYVANPAVLAAAGGTRGQ